MEKMERQIEEEDITESSSKILEGMVKPFDFPHSRAPSPTKNLENKKKKKEDDSTSSTVER